MSRKNDYRHNMLIGSSDGKPSNFGINGAHKQPQTDDAKLDFSEIWQTLRRGKWIILVVTLLVTGAVTGFTYVQEPEYEAESIVMIERSTDRGNVSFQAQRSGRDLANEIGKLRYSGELIRRVLDRLRETAGSVEGSVAQRHFPVLFDEAGERLSDAEVARALRSQMSFSTVSDQDLIRLRARSAAPEETSRLANIFAEEYQSFARESSRASAVATREFLEEQVERRGERLDEIDDRLVEFKLERDFASRGTAGEQVLQEFTQLRQRLETLESQKLEAEFRLERLQEELQNIEPDMDSRIAEDIEIETLRSEVNALSQEIAGLEQQAEEYYLNDESLRGNEEQVDELYAITQRAERLRERRDQKIQELAEESSGSRFAGREGQMTYAAQLRTNIIEAEGRVMGLNAQIETVENRLAEQRSDVQDVPRQQVEYEELQREREIVAQQHSSYLSRLHDTMMSEQSDLGYVDLVQQARVPSAPVYPDMQQNVVLGVLLGFGLGIGIAFLWRASAGRIEKPEDLQVNGYSVVGVVPDMRREIKSSFGGKDTVEVDGMLVHTSLMTLLNPWSPVAENYRLIRTNIQSSTGRVPQKMLVTSPEMGDGKTVTAANLAIVLARNGMRTLLIDADLRRPAAHDILGTSLTPGLGQRLSDTSDARKDLSGLETLVENLHFLPAGTHDDPPAELVGTRGMQDLLAAAEEQFDAVVIDSPPVLAVSDSVVLARQVDATFIVVGAERTELQALNTTRDTLEAVGGVISGVVLNRFDEKKVGYDYGYGYGYGRTEAYVAARAT